MKYFHEIPEYKRNKMLEIRNSKKYTDFLDNIVESQIDEAINNDPFVKEVRVKIPTEFDIRIVDSALFFKYGYKTNTNIEESTIVIHL